MSTNDVGIGSVAVIGGGLMGSGIAEVCARADLDVVVHEVSAEAAERALQRIVGSMSRARYKGKLTSADLEAAQRRLSVTHRLEDLADSDLVIEAIVENETAKRDVFHRLEQVLVKPEAIIASNTSSIPIIKLAMATQRPDKVIGIHFFNPVPVLRLVELVTSLLTGADTRARAEGFASQLLGKRVIHSKDRAGFIVNALLIPYILAAVRMLESGFATAEDIDAGMVEGCAHPMGPLALADLIGLDTTMAVAESLYAEFKEPLNAPPPLLVRMVEAGLLGRKNGQGFYTYR
ncbi:MAG: 3-hydroxybutyryl-CoA dehydrogenase [Ilumatobacteraceae bacterium]